MLCKNYTCSSNCINLQSCSCQVAGLDFIKLKCSDTSMAKDNILGLIIVKKWPITKPLALKATVYWLFLTRRTLEKVE